ncbi:HAUS augmin-like complex subunit 6 [Symsagittifera roscoffensis]|uniref:HAUS augmin-like complex subunit 6 n=1 Tax=Symsagittifera roscoffensis TaxID=84072 RepID=UPI00307BCB34
MSLSNYKLAAIFPVLLMMEVLIEDLAVLGLKDVCSITVRSFDVRNVKLFEKIIHFLISTISPESIQTWPVVYRNEELPFRREVVAYFKTLNHPSLSSAEVTVLLPNSAGPKCVHFLLRFSRFVLEEKMKQLDCGWMSPVSDNSVDMMNSGVSDAKLKILSQYYESDALSKMAFYESEWKKYDAAYQQLMTEHKRLSKQMEVTRRAIAKKGHDCPVDVDSDLVAATADNMQECLSILDQIDSYSSSVSYTLNKKANADPSDFQGLDSSRLNVQVPNAVNSYLQHQQENGRQSLSEQPLFEAEKLNLITLSSLANLSLEVFKEEKPEVKMTNCEDASNLVEQLDSINEQIEQLTLSVETQMSVLSSQL